MIHRNMCNGCINMLEGVCVSLLSLTCLRVVRLSDVGQDVFEDEGFASWCRLLKTVTSERNWKRHLRYVWRKTEKREDRCSRVLLAWKHVNYWRNLSFKMTFLPSLFIWYSEIDIERLDTCSHIHITKSSFVFIYWYIIAVRTDYIHQRALLHHS